MSQIRNASDTTCKQFLRDGECFADLCNALYFHGRQVIKPENLISRENDVSTLIGKEPLPMKMKRYRDIVRKASINGDYMIIGIEHQSTLDKNMIIRILNYAAQLYINQVERGKEVLEISQSMFEGDYEKLRIIRMISVGNYKMASILTHTDIKEEDLPEGNKINMCKAMDQLFQRFENQGIEKNLKELLKVKLGTLSNPLEERLTTTSLEKLNELTLNIFNINSEEDVLKIIH
ncbi:Putative transposase%2C YhgA-like [uncultured Clostridium sp.]|nr:Putative transposase%2C YhgA-like [uncultured Clostridium sp.]